LFYFRIQKSVVYKKMGVGKKFVSIVDDEIDITALFHDALTNKIGDITFVCFNEPAPALEHFIDNKRNYALVISDLRMPGMSGLELLKYARELNPKVRTILMTAYEVEHDPVFQGYMKEGVIDSLIKKPILMNSFCQEVSNLIPVKQKLNK